MAHHQTPATPSSIAVYWDMDNIHASTMSLLYGSDWYARYQGRQQPAPVQIGDVMKFLRKRGRVVVNRAYGDWSKLSEYAPELNKFTVEPIQLFPRNGHAKNGGDIAIATDVMELLYEHRHVDTIVIISGDSDFIPLAQKLTKFDRRLIGIGVRQTTNYYWARSCDQFKYYNDFVVNTTVPVLPQSPSGNVGPASAPAPPDDVPETVETAYGELLVRAVGSLVWEKGEEWVKLSRLKQRMKQFNPQFNEKAEGFLKFSEFVRLQPELVEFQPSKGPGDASCRLIGDNPVPRPAIEPAAELMDEAAPPPVHTPISKRLDYAQDDSLQLVSAEDEAWPSAAPAPEASLVDTYRLHLTRGIDAPGDQLMRGLYAYGKVLVEMERPVFLPDLATALHGTLRESNPEADTEEVRRLIDFLLVSFLVRVEDARGTLYYQPGVKDTDTVIAAVCSYAVRRLRKGLPGSDLNPRAASEALTGSPVLANAMAMA